MALSVSLLLFAAGLLLLSWRSRHGERHPLAALGGLILFFVGLLTIVLSGEAWFVVFRTLLLDAGAAFLVVALILALRRRNGRSGSRPFFAVGALLLLGGILLAALFRTPATDEGEASFLLELGPDDRIEEILPVLDAFDARYERAFPSVALSTDEDLAQTFLVYVDEKASGSLMRRLQEDVENVDHVEVNGVVRLEPPPAAAETSVDRDRFFANDPLLKHQWGLAAINGAAAHTFLRDRQPVRTAVVAILDTGIDTEHEDLQGALEDDVVDNDIHGHGTHCAGIAGAVTNNEIGIGSLNWEGRFVRLRSYRALPAAGSGTFETIAQAVIDATRDKVDVISMSLGDTGPAPPRVLSESIAYAQREGIIVIASAGNNNADAIDHYPSNIEGVIAVAAVDQELRKARFSNINTRLSRPLAAPGIGVVSLKPGSNYVPMSGTSMAAPMVAGLIGIMRSLDPELTAAEAYDVLHENGRSGPDVRRTGRVIDAQQALEAL